MTTLNYNGYEVNLIIANYTANGNIALLLETPDGNPFGKLTTNIGELPYGYAYIDTNNMPDADEFILNYKLGTFLKAYKQSGFCSYPLYKIDVKRCKMLGGVKNET